MQRGLHTSVEEICPERRLLVRLQPDEEGEMDFFYAVKNFEQ